MLLRFSDYHYNGRPCFIDHRDISRVFEVYAKDENSPRTMIAGRYRDNDLQVLESPEEVYRKVRMATALNPNDILIRFCPLANGTFAAHQWNTKTEEYDLLSPEVALRILSDRAVNSTVEVAVDDPNDKHSHFESAPSPMMRI